MYVLTAYYGLDHNDIRSLFERIRILMRYNCLPYVMRYSSYESSKYRDMYINIAKWANQPHIVKKMSYREMCEALQDRIKTEGKLSRSYSSMIEFEKEHPDIANEFFDMKWSDFGG